MNEPSTLLQSLLGKQSPASILAQVRKQGLNARISQTVSLDFSAVFRQTLTQAKPLRTNFPSANKNSFQNDYQTQYMNKNPDRYNRNFNIQSSLSQSRKDFKPIRTEQKKELSTVSSSADRPDKIQTKSSADNTSHVQKVKGKDTLSNQRDQGKITKASSQETKVSSGKSKVKSASDKIKNILDSGMTTETFLENLKKILEDSSLSIDERFASMMDFMKQLGIQPKEFMAAFQVDTKVEIQGKKEEVMAFMKDLDSYLRQNTNDKVDKSLKESNQENPLVNLIKDTLKMVKDTGKGLVQMASLHESKDNPLSHNVNDLNQDSQGKIRKLLFKVMGRLEKFRTKPGTEAKQVIQEVQKDLFAAQVKGQSKTKSHLDPELGKVVSDMKKGVEQKVKIAAQKIETVKPKADILSSLGANLGSKDELVSRFSQKISQGPSKAVGEVLHVGSGQANAGSQSSTNADYFSQQYSMNESKGSQAAIKAGKQQSAVSYTSLEPKEIFDQVVQRMQVAVKDDQREVSIQLKPEFLGKVEIKLTQGDNGLVAHFATESSHVQGALQSHLGALREALNNSGVRVERFDVVVMNASSSDGNFDQEQGQRQEQGKGKGSGNSDRAVGSVDWDDGLSEGSNRSDWIARALDSQFYAIG